MSRSNPIRAYVYLRLSVDKEDGTPPSIEAQRSSISDYQTYVARTDGKKERKKLAVVPAEAEIVKRIFEWAGSGRGGR